MSTTKGLVFDIEEFAVFDGPGIRSVVFLKGCPLRCAWCHNPEGLEHRSQLVKTPSLCSGCGLCDEAFHSDADCVDGARYVSACPRGALRLAGTWMSAEEVADRIRRHEKLLTLNHGGVTFSGGEPLLQADFVLAVRALLPSLHAAIETSGYAPSPVFQKVAAAMDLVMMDIKIIDPLLHVKYTGVQNDIILQNFALLKSMNKTFRIRVPLIPTVNDTPQNMQALADLLQDAKHLEKVELMRYNQAAGAKYAGVGMIYDVDFPEKQPPRLLTEIFEEAGIPCDVL